MADIPGGWDGEPSPEVRSMALQLRQVFVALIAEGFTEAQALNLIGNILTANARTVGNG